MADDHDIEAARQDAATRARAEVRAATGRRLIHLTAAEINGGRIPADRLGRLLDHVNVERLLTDTGDVNRHALTDLIAAAAGDPTPPARRRTFPDLGQGRRPTSTPAGTIQSGRDKYQARNRRPAPSRRRS